MFEKAMVNKLEAAEVPETEVLHFNPQQLLIHPKLCVVTQVIPFKFLD